MKTCNVIQIITIFKQDIQVLKTFFKYYNLKNNKKFGRKYIISIAHVNKKYLESRFRISTVQNLK